MEAFIGIYFRSYLVHRNKGGFLFLRFNLLSVVRHLSTVGIGNIIGVSLWRFMIFRNIYPFLDHGVMC